MVRGKSKNNPLGKCISCGINIINKNKSSIYCKDCANIYLLIKRNLGNTIYKLRKKYPFKKINYRLTLKIKNDI